MICKQKKLVKVLLLTVVVSLFTMTTAFAQEYPTQNNNARYIGISMLNAQEKIFLLYRPLLFKEACVYEVFDEDLFQELSMTLVDCIRLFQL